MDEFSELEVMKKHTFDSGRFCCSCEGEWYQYRAFPGGIERGASYWLSQAYESHRLHVEMEIWKEKRKRKES